MLPQPRLVCHWDRAPVMQGQTVPQILCSWSTIGDMMHRPNVHEFCASPTTYLFVIKSGYNNLIPTHARKHAKLNLGNLLVV